MYYSAQLPPDQQVALLAEVLYDVDEEQREQCVQFAQINSVPVSAFSHLESLTKHRLTTLSSA